MADDSTIVGHPIPLPMFGDRTILPLDRTADFMVAASHLVRAHPPTMAKMDADQQKAWAEFAAAFYNLRALMIAEADERAVPTAAAPTVGDNLG